MNQRHFIDFKLLLTRPHDGQGCQVSLLPTLEVGETVTPVIVPDNKGPTRSLLSLLASKSIPMKQLVELGKGLANWLLPEESLGGQASIRSLFEYAVKQAGNTGGVRLRLILADNELKQLPWEYVHCNTFGVGGPDSMSGFLALDPRFSLVRHEPLPHPHPTYSGTDKSQANLRVVIAAASPKTQSQLNVNQEASDIADAVKLFRIDGGELAPILLTDATAPDIAQALKGASSATIFHFAGHGISESVGNPFAGGGTRDEGFIFLLEDKVRKTESKVRADDLAKLLQSSGVRLAVFSACYSGTRSERYPWDGVAGALTVRDVPATIAMQYEVFDTHALAFAKALYCALAAGLSLDEAMSLGRQGMWGVSSQQPEQQGYLEWGVPVLYSRLPDGVLFPDRMEHAGEAANGLRVLIKQTVGTITKTGRVVGIAIKTGSGVFEVVQVADLVEGEIIGLTNDCKSATASTIDVGMKLGTVSGKATGVTLNKC